MFSFLKRKEPKKSRELGRDESKHIRCKYKNKDKCPLDCNECHFSVKLKGDFMMQVQAYDSAAELYEEAVGKEPGYAEGWQALGNALTFRGDHEQAREAFEKALEIDERYGEALYGKAVALKNMYRLEDALNAIEDVLFYYDYPGCYELRTEIHRMEAEEQEREAQKLEEKNRLLMKMMRKAAERGYIKDRMPTVPELTALSDEFIPECFMRMTGKNKYTLEAVKSGAVCCFYGGFGIAGLWKQHWRDYSLEGIRRDLFEPRGFECMDEYACALHGIEYESAVGQELKRFAKELSGIVLNVIMNQVGAVRMDDFQMEELVKDAMRDVYMVGAGIGLYH